MRAATVMAVALATFSSFPVTAQQQETPAQQQSAPQQPGAEPVSPDNSQPVQTSPPQNGAAIQANPAASAASVQLQPVNSELVGKLDSTSAKTGDSVVVKTKENMKTADGTEIPKGSKLVGKITGVLQRGEGKENSQIAIKFDHAELKGGQSVGIESVIESLSPAGGDSTSMTTPGGIGGPTTGISPIGNSGGNMSGSVNTGRTNMPANNTTQGAQSTTAPSTQGLGQPGANGGTNSPAPGSVVARSGNVAIRMTSIPGVLLANNVNGQPFSNASSLLVGAQRDIKLDGGTQLVVGVATVPGGAGGGTSMNR